jgi:thiosulfate dehydrogenase [quinone] large subunit
MDPTLNRTQQTALVVLRTLIGWHFLYEGFVKTLWLRSSTGPLADLFHRLADVSWLPWADQLMAWSLLLVGLGLMLGLFTQLACAGGLALLLLFYVSWFPTRGVYEPGAEGNYLLVNKNLVEAAAVGVVFLFRTGRIAGLDLLRGRERAQPLPPVAEATR